MRQRPLPSLCGCALLLIGGLMRSWRWARPTGPSSHNDCPAGPRCASVIAMRSNVARSGAGPRNAKRPVIAPMLLSCFQPLKPERVPHRVALYRLSHLPHLPRLPNLPPQWQPP